MAEKKQPKFRQITVMLLMTAFQLLSAGCVIFRQEEPSMTLIYIFFGFIAVEWLYMLIGNLVTDSDYFELEVIAFFLSGIGLTVCASFNESYALKQVIAIGTNHYDSWYPYCVFEYNPENICCNQKEGVLKDDNKD